MRDVTSGALCQGEWGISSPLVNSELSLTDFLEVAYPSQIPGLSTKITEGGTHGENVAVSFVLKVPVRLERARYTVNMPVVAEIIGENGHYCPGFAAASLQCFFCCPCSVPTPGCQEG